MGKRIHVAGYIRLIVAGVSIGCPGLAAAQGGDRPLPALMSGAGLGPSTTPHYDKAQVSETATNWAGAYKEYLLSIANKEVAPVGQRSRLLADTRFRAAYMARRLGKVKEALRLHEDLINEYAAATNHAGLELIYRLNGMTYEKELRDYEKARYYYKKWGEESEQLGNIAGGNGQLYALICEAGSIQSEAAGPNPISEANRRKIHAILEKAMKLVNQYYPKDEDDLWRHRKWIQETLAEIDRDPDKTLQLAIRALSEAQTTNQFRPLYEAFAEFKIGYAYELKAKPGDANDREAMRHYETALQKYGNLDCLFPGGRSKTVHDVEWINGAIGTALRLSKLQLQFGRKEEANQTARKGLSYLSIARECLAGDTAKLTMLGGYEHSMLDHAVQVGFQSKHPETAFEALEVGKAAALCDLLGGKEPESRKAHLAEATRERDILLAKVDEIQKAMRAERNVTDTNQVASFQRSLILVQDQAERLKEDIESCRTELTSMTTVAPIELAKVQKLIGNAVLLHYWYPNRCLVVTRDKVEMMTVGKFPDANKIKLFREAMYQEASRARGLDIEGTKVPPPGTPNTASALALARTFYDALIKPMAGKLADHPLILIPERDLNLLPFHALYDGEKYLIEKHTLSYAPSATVLQFCMAKHKPIRGTILALGDPNLKDPRYKLAHASEEVVAIKKAFPDARVLVGDQATETAVRLLGPGCDVVHLACHGTVDLNDPGKSCLRLSPDQANDGYLHAGEAVLMDLPVGLVTLSACESGVGAIKPSNDVLGLPRAFLVAGAPAVIASLWKVDDAATAELMVDFYSRLKDKGKAEALREAQVGMIKKGSPPFQWAAFCLNGDFL